MSSFDDCEITIKLREFNDNPLAIVSITLGDQYEVRYAVIEWKNKKSELFFNMPSLGRFGFRHCFVYLDCDEYHKVSIEILQKFKEMAQKKYSKEQVEIIERLVNERIKHINDPSSDRWAKQ